MNIKDISRLGHASPVDSSRGKAPAPRPGEQQGDAAAAAATGDQLTLTGIGRYLAANAGEQAPVDRERVDAIRSALADGSYEIDSARVAARLLRLERGLI